MTIQADPHSSIEDLSESLRRGYLTALTLLGDAPEAEVLVMGAISSLIPECITGEAIRNAIVQRLVEAQMARKECTKT